MRLILCAIAVSLTACNPPLLANTVVLVETQDDFQLVDGALENFRPYVGVEVVVTKSREVFDTWPTFERWKLKTAQRGERHRDTTICDPSQTSGDFGLSDPDTKTVWIGVCVPPDERPFVIGHELGHMVGAGHSSSGVMVPWQPSTLELSRETKRELQEIY